MADFNAGLVPGGNPGGSNMGGGNSPFGSNAPGLGGNQNPLLPMFPSQSQVPPPTSMLAPGATAGPAQPGSSSTVAPAATNAMSGVNVGNLLGFGQNGGNTNASGGWAPNMNDFVKAFKKAGYSAGDAALLYNFLQSGAGFSQDAANALFAAMQPQIQRQEEDLLEQFSGQGVRSGSPAAIGVGDYLSQVNLNQGQIEAGMYEQAVQNYMNILLAGKGNYKSTFDNINQGLNTYANILGAAGKAAAAGG